MEGERIEQRRSLVAPAFFVLGLVLEVLLVLASPFMAFVSGIRSDSCWNDCSYGVIGLGSAVTIGAPLAVLIAVVVVAVIRRHGRTLTWLPYAGIALTVGLWWIAFALTDAGLPGGALAP